MIQEFNLIVLKNAKDLELVRNLFAIDVNTLPESFQRQEIKNKRNIATRT